jgi:hypothetical protein
MGGQEPEANSRKYRMKLHHYLFKSLSTREAAPRLGYDFTTTSRPIRMRR